MKWFCFIFIFLFLLLEPITGFSDSLTNSPPAAEKSRKTRIVVIPFQNATGNSDWDAWQHALPSLVRGFLSSYDSAAVPRRKRVKMALDRAGWKPSEPVRKFTPDIARELKADVVVWGTFLRRTNQWIVSARLFQKDWQEPFAECEVASTGWNGIADALAKEVAARLSLSLDDEELRRWHRYMSDSEAALANLAKASALHAQDAPVSEQERLLRQAIADDPRCGLGYSDLTDILVKAERTNELATVIREFVKNCPDLCDAHCQMAWVLRSGGDTTGAERELREALRLHRGCPGAARTFMHLYSSPESASLLRAVLEDAHKDRPEAISTTILLAYRRTEDGDLQGARDLMRGIAELPEEEEDDTIDLTLFLTATRTGNIQLISGELARLGPRTLTSGMIASAFDSFKIESMKPASHRARLTRPRNYTPAELAGELQRRLTPEERKLVVNPLEITPEIDAEARRITLNITNNVLRWFALFCDISQRGRGSGDGAARTAHQALEQSKDPETRFSCQEYAKLFVAMARALGLEAWLVHVDRDQDGNPCYHDCAALFVDDQGFLLDPTWGVPDADHEEFVVLDDLQAISHHAMQPAGTPEPQRLRMGLKLNPVDRWTRLQYVRGMAVSGEYTAASQALEELKSAGGETWDIHQAAGTLEYSREHWNQALEELQRALALSPSNALVHVQLARVYAAVGQTSNSVEHMEAALRLNRGEITSAAREEAVGRIPTLKVAVRDEIGDPSARAELVRLAGTGDAIAMIALAKACFRVTPAQIEEGLRWLLKAAERGSAQAQYEYARNLALLPGKAGSPEIIKWLTRSAEAGLPQAQFQLGFVLYEGKVVAKDPVAAGQWIILSTRQGNTEAKHLWKEMELFLTADELKQARDRADAFKPKDETPEAGS